MNKQIKNIYTLENHIVFNKFRFQKKKKVQKLIGLKKITLYIHTI